MTPPCAHDLNEGKCTRCGKCICFIMIELCNECMEIIIQEKEAILASKKN